MASDIMRQSVTSPYPVCPPVSGTVRPARGVPPPVGAVYTVENHTNLRAEGVLASSLSARSLECLLARKMHERGEWNLHYVI